MSFGNGAVAQFLLVFVRVSTLFTLAPCFSSAHLPKAAKISMALVLTFFVNGLVPRGPLPADGILAFSGSLLGEFAAGYVLVFLLNIIMAAVQMGMGMVSLQMGFGLGGVFNPDTGSDTDRLSESFGLWASVLFLVFNGHHRLLEALVKSFAYVPAGSVLIGPIVLKRLIVAFGGLFVSVLQLTGPLLMSLWLAGVGVAMLSRFLPTLNIFLVDLPIKVTVGFVLMALTLTRFSNAFSHLITGSWSQMKVLLVLLHG